MLWALEADLSGRPDGTDVNVTVVELSQGCKQLTDIDVGRASDEKWFGQKGC